MNKRAILKLLPIVLASTFVLIGCGNSKDSEKTEVTIGYFNNVTHPQALYMKAQKLLENAYGDTADVAWTAFNAGPAEVEALFSGSIDIGYIGPVPAINANVKSKGDVVILSGVSKGGAVLVKKKDADIKSIADLAGKNVAIPQIGNTQHLCLLDLLANNGLSPVTEGGDVTINAVENADVANTMNRGDIDVALVPEPWATTLAAQGADIMLDYDQIYMDGNYDVAVVVVRKEFQENHPELVEEFLKQHEAATAAINDNPTESLPIINSELEAATGKSLSEDILKEAFTRIGVSTELNKDSIAGFGELSVQQNFIKEAPAEQELYAE